MPRSGRQSISLDDHPVLAGNDAAREVYTQLRGIPLRSVGSQARPVFAHWPRRLGLATWSCHRLPTRADARRIPISDLRRAPRMHPRVSSRVVHYRFISRFMRVIAFIPNRGHLRNEKSGVRVPLAPRPQICPLTRSLVLLTGELDCRAFCLSPDDAVVELSRPRAAASEKVSLASVSAGTVLAANARLSGSLLDPPTTVPVPLTTNKKVDLD
jgi:hypothetical protein